MRALLYALVLTSVALPAHAALAPHYYEQARAEAADVVVIDVSSVTPPVAATTGHGPCVVAGTVAAVERGARYTVGEEITIEVLCRLPHAEMMVGPVQWKDVATLSAAPRGRAFLNNGEIALYQYDVLSER